MFKNIYILNFSCTSQTFVLAAIQLEVSESSSHFLIHFLSRWHLTGSCQFSPQAKQNVWVHLQVTGRASTYCTLIALLQSGDGHHLNNLLHCKWKPNLHIQIKDGNSKCTEYNSGKLFSRQEITTHLQTQIIKTRRQWKCLQFPCFSVYLISFS